MALNGPGNGLSEGPPGTPPGWYPDPSGAGLRYWDGARWTDDRAKASAPPRSSTSGLAIASLVFGILGGPILAIPLGLVAKRRIRDSGGRLGGNGLATAGIALGCAWLAVLALAFALGLAGVFDNDNASRYQGEERQVARTVDATQQAFDDGDGDRLCNELFTARFADLLPHNGKGSCSQQMAKITDGKREADITVKRIVISGDTATVDLVEGDTPQRWTMLKQEGVWRIDHLDAAQAEAGAAP